MKPSTNKPAIASILVLMLLAFAPGALPGCWHRWGGVGTMAAHRTGALIVLPGFALGRALHGVGFGVGVAGLLAIFPGGLMHRTSLGHADHHAAEALFALTTLALPLVFTLGCAHTRRASDPPPPPQWSTETSEALIGAAALAAIVCLRRGHDQVARLAAMAGR